MAEVRIDVISRPLRVDIVTGATSGTQPAGSVADWAQGGNTDLVPHDKLAGNTPRVGDLMAIISGGREWRKVANENVEDGAITTLKLDVAYRNDILTRIAARLAAPIDLRVAGALPLGPKVPAVYRGRIVWNTSDNTINLTEAQVPAAIRSGLVSYLPSHIGDLTGTQSVSNVRVGDRFSADGNHYEVIQDRDQAFQRDDIDDLVTAGTIRQLNAATGDTGITANPADDATAALLKATIGDTTFSVGRVTYADVEGSPINSGNLEPTFDGEVWINRIGQAWLAGDSITTRPSDPSIEDQAFTNSYYTPDVADQDADGEFRSYPNDGYIQRRGQTTFITDWSGAWTYIATIDDTADNREFRDNWIDIGAHDDADAAALALSHRSDKDDADKTFVWVVHADGAIRQITSFTDSTPVRQDNRYWVGPIQTPDTVRAAIAQYAPPDIKILLGAALPAANTIEDEDRQKLFGLAADAMSPVDTWYHLKPANPKVGEFTAAEDPDNDGEIGFAIGDDGYGNSPDPINITKFYQYDGSANHKILRVEVSADGTIPEPSEGTDVAFWYREFGSDDEWRGWLITPGTHYTSTQSQIGPFLQAGKRYEYAVSDTGPGTDVTRTTVRGTAYDIHPGGVRWTSIPDSYDLEHSDVRIEVIETREVEGTGGATNLSVTTGTDSVTVRSDTGTDATIQEATASAAGVMSTAHHNKLDGIHALAEQNAVDSVAGASQGGIGTSGSSIGNVRLFLALDNLRRIGSPTYADNDDLWVMYNDDEGEPIALTTAQVKALIRVNPTVEFPASSRADGILRLAISPGGDTALVPIATDSLAGIITGAEHAKLGGIAAGAQVNPPAARLVPTGSTAGQALLGGTTPAFRDRIFTTYDSAATYIAGDQVVLTQDEYDAIASPVDGVIYKISA